jgi:hypothetical protein
MTVGLTLPDVEATTKYDGSPVLKVGGCFVAGLATHRSAEPDTLVVRTDFDERQWLIDDAPDSYYVTDYYRNYPVVLVRLSRIDQGALRDLLSVSWRLAMAKARRPRCGAMMRKGNARMRLQFDNLTFDPKSRQLWADGTEPHLSLKAFADWCAADE